MLFQNKTKQKSGLNSNLATLTFELTFWAQQAEQQQQLGCNIFYEWFYSLDLACKFPLFKHIKLNTAALNWIKLLCIKWHRVAVFNYEDVCPQKLPTSWNKNLKISGTESIYQILKRLPRRRDVEQDEDRVIVQHRPGRGGHSGRKITAHNYKEPPYCTITLIKTINKNTSKRSCCRGTKVALLWKPQLYEYLKCMTN